MAVRAEEEPAVGNPLFRGPAAQESAPSGKSNIVSMPRSLPRPSAACLICHQIVVVRPPIPPPLPRCSGPACLTFRQIVRALFPFSPSLCLAQLACCGFRTVGISPLVLSFLVCLPRPVPPLWSPSLQPLWPVVWRSPRANLVDGIFGHVMALRWWRSWSALAVDACSRRRP